MFGRSNANKKVQTRLQYKKYRDRIVVSKGTSAYLDKKAIVVYERNMNQEQEGKAFDVDSNLIMSESSTVGCVRRRERDLRRYAERDLLAPCRIARCCRKDPCR